MVGCADFETTTLIDDCRVWAYSISEIGNTDNFLWGNSIDSFMDICADKKTNHVFYFHNLAFDGEFIFYWLGRNGFELVKNKKDFKDKTYTTLISDKGQFYSIEICFQRKGHKINKVKFMDSLKILNFSVSQIAKGFNLPIAKLKIDYEKTRPVNYILTQEEISYIRNDVEIVARALKILFDLGMDKMTIGADALSEYKNVIGKEQFIKWFPIPALNVDNDVRGSYKGGFTYLADSYKGKTITGGIVLDVNSLYPSVMHDRPLPYGEPVFFEGKYKEDKLYNLYVQKFSCQFELKENHIPTIQIKNTLSFLDTEYLKSSGDEEVVLTLTSVDYELFLEHYNIYNVYYIRGYKFKSSTQMFKTYVDKWTEEKTKAKKEGNKAMYTLSKLMLNSLYGKFSVNPAIRSKYPEYNILEDKIKYIDGDWEERNPVYIPVGTFITSWARYKTITSAQKNYNVFAYADTDSLHLATTEVPKDLEINDYTLGAWKHEFTFSKAVFLRQKTYMEKGREPHETCEEYTKITCAGMPKTCYEHVSFDNFKLGSKYGGKLQRTRVQGGIVLKSIDFTIKKG